MKAKPRATYKFQQVQPAVTLKLGKTTGYVTNQPDVQAKIIFQIKVKHLSQIIKRGAKKKK